MPETATIAIVGHCGADSYSLSRLARQAVPQAQVVVVDDEASLAGHRHAGAIWLVNRVLDGAFTSAGGIELIQKHARDDGATMVLISNFADAQDKAVAAGAAPGFGKRDLGSPRVAELLRSLLDRHESSPIKPASTGD